MSPVISFQMREQGDRVEPGAPALDARRKLAGGGTASTRRFACSPAPDARRKLAGGGTEGIRRYYLFAPRRYCMCARRRRGGN